jgi:subtilase family serine protease
LSSSFQAVFNSMIGSGVTIISNSCSYCEDQTTLADVQTNDAIFQTAAASGITVLNASGHNGSTCLGTDGTRCHPRSDSDGGSQRPGADG